MHLDDKEYVTVRVGSYNIASGDPGSAHSMEGIAKDILEKDLDIIGMQEVDRGCQRTDYADMPRLLSEYTGYPYYYYSKCVSLWGKEGAGSGEYGDCVLSKYPIREAEHTILEHTVPGQKSREPRSLSHVQVDVNGTVIHFHNTHLEHSHRKEEHQALRLTQLAQIAGLLRDVPNAILTGDFNCPPEEQYGAIPFLSGVCRAKGDPITYPASGNTIDNILYSRDVELVSLDLLHSGNSDHSMLYAEFKVKK